MSLRNNAWKGDFLMPDLGIDDFDIKAIDPDTRQRFVETVKYQQRVYYWMLLALGCLLFIVGALV